MCVCLNIVPILLCLCKNVSREVEGERVQLIQFVAY
jgi:hypothetical protein